MGSRECSAYAPESLTHSLVNTGSRGDPDSVQIVTHLQELDQDIARLANT